jgi:GPH family glycoside/pentoside/hexuronide:cation symporter
MQTSAGAARPSGPTPSAPAPAEPLGGQARVAMASAGMAAGIIDNGISYFLLIYYSQVLGLSPSLAGGALGLALVFDAISDPLIGAWSDRLRSRLGRRHPFMYASLIPVAGLYYLLWTPPVDASDQGALFSYLVVVAILLRTSLTLFDVPMNAMVPELTSDYDERTELFNYRVSSGWIMGTAIAVVMYGYWIADTPEYPDGIMNAEGYVEAAAWGAGLIFLGAAVAAFGTHRYIPRLRQPSARRKGFWVGVAEYRETLSDRSFLAIIGSRIIGQSAAGTAIVLWVYVQDYIWQFESWQLTWMMVSQMVAPFLSFFATPWVASRRDKKPLMIGLSIASIAANAGPVTLHTMGWFAEPGDPLLFPLMVVIGGLQVIFIAMTTTLGASMLADVVESREVVTGRREEGTLVAFQTFIYKATSGLGAWMGGLILSYIAFPLQAAPGEASPEAVFDLALVYGPVLTVLYLASIGVLLFYRIDRVTHEANLATLLRRSQMAPDGVEEPDG